MIGSHWRMLEALDKEIPIHFLFVSFQHAEYHMRRAYEIYDLKPRQLRTINTRLEAIAPNKQLIRFKPLSHSTYQDLLGWKGCVFIHPDAMENLLNPKYAYKNVQELMINNNVRHRPWRD